MKPRDILLLVLVTVTWGFNFVPVRLALDHVPPLTLTTIRFFLTAFPALFFVKRPNLPLWKIALYGCVLFAGQFGFLFSGIRFGMSAGLASIALQTQAFFTIGLAALLLREKPLMYQIVGALVAGCGIMLVGAHVGGDVTMLGLSFMLLAAFCWSLGNLMIKTFGKVDIFSLIIWGNLFAMFLMAVLAFSLEGPEAIHSAFIGMNMTTILSIAYITYASTFFGYSVWTHTMSHYPAASVAPFTLLVPIFGMLSTSLFLGESFPMWKLGAACLVLSGLVINQFGDRLHTRMAGILARKVP